MPIDARMTSVKAPRREGWVSALEYLPNHDSGASGGLELPVDTMSLDRSMSCPGASAGAGWDSDWDAD